MVGALQQQMGNTSAKFCWKILSPGNVTLHEHQHPVQSVRWGQWGFPEPNPWGRGAPKSRIWCFQYNNFFLKPEVWNGQKYVFHLKHISVVRKLPQTCHFSIVDPSLEPWDSGKLVMFGEEHSSVTCIPQQGTRREFYCSALTEVVLICVEQKLQNSGLGLVWQSYKQPTVA